MQSVFSLAIIPRVCAAGARWPNNPFLRKCRRACRRHCLNAGPIFARSSRT